MVCRPIERRSNAPTITTCFSSMSSATPTIRAASAVDLPRSLPKSPLHSMAAARGRLSRVVAALIGPARAGTSGCSAGAWGVLEGQVESPRHPWFGSRRSLSRMRTVMASILTALATLGVLVGSTIIGACVVLYERRHWSGMAARTRRFVRSNRRPSDDSG